MTGKFKFAAAAAAVLVTSAAFTATKTAPPRFEGMRDADTYGTARPTVKDVPADQSSCLTLSNFGNPGDAARRYCGIAGSDNTFVYLGIRYANAARWQRAEGTLPATGTYNATSYQQPCPQTLPDHTTVIGAEDCLFLNVWAPRNAINSARSLPVLVFIHGGAFVTGSGGMNGDHISTYNGSKLAARGAIVVTLNYRLGALGFLASDTKDTASAGNFGLHDQQVALSWVNLFIKSFGGNTNNITIFGESAGAMSVGLQLFDMREGSKPQFQKAIMESNPLASYYHPAARARIVGNQFVDYLCSQARKKKAACTGNWASQVPFEKVVVAQNAFLDADHGGNQTNAAFDADNHLIGMRSLLWQPNVDGKLVLGEPYDGYAAYGPNGQRLPGKPFIIGMNRDEGVVFAAVVASGLNANNPSAEPAPLVYLGLLDNSFGPLNHIAENNRYNHNAAGGRHFDYYSADGQALANVIGDYSFVCGADKTARTALSQYSQVPVFAYYFSQPPFFDMSDPENVRPANGPCKPNPGNPGAANVCHAEELPYVFESLDIVTANSHGGYVPTPADRTVAEKVATNWFEFASATTPADWAQFTAAAHNAKQFAEPVTQATVSLDEKGLCTAMWANRYGPPPAK